MPVEKIANRQIFFILFIMRTTIIISFLPVLTSADAAQDAWAAAFVTFAGTALLVYFIATLGTFFPGKTVIQYSQEIAGAWAGRLLSLFYLWAFLYMAAVDIRVYAEVITTGFLTETPLIFIIAAMAIASAIAAYAGIEVIGRAADLIFPGFVAVLLLSIIVQLPVIDLSNLEPVLASGAQPVLLASITPIAVGMQALILTMIQAHAKQPDKVPRSGFQAIAGSSAALLAVAIVTIGVLGADAGTRSAFPFFRAIRSIEVSKFMERIEAPLIFAWEFGLFIGVSVLIYCVAKGASQWFNIKDYRPLIMPITVIWVTLAVHNFEDIFEMHLFFRPWIIGPYILFLILPHGLLWIIYGFKKLLGKQR